jgi:hypothetical protein
MYIWGLQIGLNFVPATKTETRNDGSCDFCRHEIEFFLWSNVTNGWFFDIYIQGSKNTTLRAESEIAIAVGR